MRISIKTVTLSAVLTALALLLFLVEAQIPSFTAIPGIKLGLANIMTLVAMRLLDKKHAAVILLTRILLGSIFHGQLVSFLYSLSGGVLCFLALCLFDRFLSDRQIWALSVIGAIFHNIGQIAAAVVLMQSVQVLWYLPYLMISAVVSGSLTGLAAQLLIPRLKKIDLSHIGK